ncbi:MAG: argininosuccinate lyase [SAR324 cluster bacterium]|nr:argininosuccinate lyase [SAR324 cluster bacterium]
MSETKTQVWGARLKAGPNETNIAFCAGRDVATLPMCDQRLLSYDIWTNLSHAQMLKEVGVLNSEEFQAIKKGLLAISELERAGKFELDPKKEDVHINIEHYLVETLGIEAAKKIHSGRSRNDQVATDMRAYIRGELLELSQDLGSLINAILHRAESEVETVMPGFTHYQPAMITTFGHWLTSWSQGLIRDLQALKDILETVNLCPLGAAASFGTSWPINRERTAELLGFAGVEENSLDCVSSRGELEGRAASALSFMSNHLAQIGQDLILLSHPYFGMVEIHDSFVTGSSIMPQKRNPDFAEVLRGKAAFVSGGLNALLGVLKGGMSGYNRDVQLTKPLIMDLFDEVKYGPQVLEGVVISLVTNKKEMSAKAAQGFTNAADVADWLAMNFSLSFRDCYQALSLAVKYSEEVGELTTQGMNRALEECGIDQVLDSETVAMLNNPLSILDKKRHTGAPSPAMVKKAIINQRDKLGKLLPEFEKIKTQVEKARASIFSA